MTRYTGGKNGAGVFQQIINCIPWHWRYVEAFAGSAAVFRHKARAPGGSILIERDREQGARLQLELASPDVTILAGANALEWLPHECMGLGPHTFVYLDPPYHPDARRDLALYRHELTAADHHQLLTSILPALTAARCSWALSGYRCAAYDDAAGAYGWHRLDYQAMTRRGVVTESLWTNFDPAMVDKLHDYRWLGRDFRERERIGRKVARWAGKLEKLPRHERGAILAALASTAAIADGGSSTLAGAGDTTRCGEGAR